MTRDCNNLGKGIRSKVAVLSDATNYKKNANNIEVLRQIFFIILIISDDIDLI